MNPSKPGKTLDVVVIEIGNGEIIRRSIRLKVTEVIVSRTIIINAGPGEEPNEIHAQANQPKTTT